VARFLALDCDAHRTYISGIERPNRMLENRENSRNSTEKLKSPMPRKVQPQWGNTGEPDPDVPVPDFKLSAEQLGTLAGILAPSRGIAFSRAAAIARP
jgi:hypothetical protein